MPRDNLATPMDLAARERLRDQQLDEARALATVLAAYRRLAVEQRKADRSIEQARCRVAVQRDAANDTVRALIKTSGVARVAILLDRPQRELVRLERSGRSAPAHGGGRPPAPDVPA